MTMTQQMAERARSLVLEYLADGEWHLHSDIVWSLREKMNQHALRDALSSMRLRGDVIEARYSQPSYRHGKSWSYRLKRKP
jgi:hypothetical protein